MKALRAAKEALKAKNRISAKVHSRVGSQAITGKVPLINKPIVNIQAEHYTFPIMTSEEVKRFETSVRQDGRLRKQYVNFLRECMEEHKNLVEVLRRAFGDDVFKYYTTSHPRKASLRNLSIFSDCMLEAWPAKSHASLHDDLLAAISQMLDR